MAILMSSCADDDPEIELWETPTYVPNVMVSTFSTGYGIDIDMDDQGNLYYAVNDYGQVYKVNPDGEQSLFYEIPGEEERELYGIAVDHAGNIYLTQFTRILKVTPNGIASVFAGGSEIGYADGNAEEARFNIPFGIDVDDQGNVFVTDLQNYKIRRISPNGEVTTIAGTTQGSIDGDVNEAQFQSPIGIKVASNGTIYVADASIRMITGEGKVTTIAGSSSGYTDGPAEQAQFQGPRSIETDAAGNLYITDLGNHVIRVINNKNEVLTVAGSSVGNTDGTGESAQFCSPRGITIDSDGNLYVTQGGGCSGIRKISFN